MRPRQHHLHRYMAVLLQILALPTRRRAPLVRLCPDAVGVRVNAGPAPSMVQL